MLVIARPEPENSILEIVRAFSKSKRGHMLVVLGDYQRHKNKYHSAVLDSASDEVVFPGAIYDSVTVEALRFNAIAYIHGHTVGGSNPSLIEAMGAGQPVLAHDNKFNRWVAGEGALYFSDEYECSSQLSVLLNDQERLKQMSIASKRRFKDEFTWTHVLDQYEKLLLKWVR